MHKILVACLLFVFLSCADASLVYGEFQPIKDKWDKDHIIEFELPVMDSLKTFDLHVNLRNTQAYPYNNIFLILSMEYPEGKVSVDTLEYTLAHPDGRWMGKKMGGMNEHVLWYKENFRFEEGGNYKLKIQHAVRKNGQIEGDQLLSGIKDVGYSIKKINDTN